jgi:hypothetical protein
MSKITRALYPKRPALIAMLDSLGQAYVRDDDLGARAPFAECALGLVRGYRATWTATGPWCRRSGRISRCAVTGSPRCGSSIC